MDPLEAVDDDRPESLVKTVADKYPDCLWGYKVLIIPLLFIPVPVLASSLGQIFKFGYFLIIVHLILIVVVLRLSCTTTRQFVKLMIWPTAYGPFLLPQRELAMSPSDTTEETQTG